MTTPLEIQLAYQEGAEARAAEFRRQAAVLPWWRWLRRTTLTAKAEGVEWAQIDSMHNFTEKHGEKYGV